MNKLFTIIILLLAIPLALAYSHPSTIYKSTDVSWIQTKSSDPTYSAYIYDASVSIAVQANKDWAYLNESERCLTAKSAAFIYMLNPSTYAAYGNKARDFLNAMDINNYDDPQELATGLTLCAQAYDILIGAGYGSMPTALTKLRNHLDVLNNTELLVDQFGFEKGYATGLNTKNNAAIRRHAAVVVAAIATDSMYVDIAEHMAVINDALDNMIDEDGGWAEGPYFMDYTYEILFPYFYSMLNNGLWGYFYEDYIQKNFMWSFKTRMPNGDRPNHDDAKLIYFPTALLSNEPEGGYYNYDFDLIGRDMSRINPNLWVEFFVKYNASVASAVPDYKSVVLTEAGSVALRSGWGNDSVYLFMSAEHYDPRIKGFGHEHGDSGSIIIHANNRTMIHAAGYAGNESDDLRTGDAHNTIIIDNNPIGGPDAMGIAGGGTDAFVMTSILSDKIDYVEARVNNNGADFRRGILFPKKKFFIMYDLAQSDVSHTYKLMLHGMGGGTTGGVFSPGWPSWNGGIYQYQGSNILAYTASNAGSPTSFSTNSDVFAPYGTRLSHSTYEATKTGQDLTFLTILYPYTGGVNPGVWEFTTSNAYAQALTVENLEGAVSQASSSYISYTLNSNTYITDGKFSYVDTAGDDVFAASSTYFYKNGLPLYDSSYALDAIYLDRSSTHWNGSIDIDPNSIDSPVSVRFYVYNEPKSVYVENGHSSYIYPYLTLYISGPTDYSIELNTETREKNFNSNFARDDTTLTPVLVPVIPQPKDSYVRNYRTTIDANWDIIAYTTDSNFMNVARELQTRIYETYGYNLSIIGRMTYDNKDMYHIYLGPYSYNPAGVYPSIPSSITSRYPNSTKEAYIIDMYAENIYITSDFSYQGLWNGIQTFMQLLENSDKEFPVSIPAARILDYPSMEYRGSYNYNHNAAEFMDLWPRYKMNSILFYKDYFNVNPSVWDSYRAEMNDYRNNFIKPVPLVMGWGWAGELLIKNGSFAEGYYVKDKKVPMDNVNDINYLLDPAFDNLGKYWHYMSDLIAMVITEGYHPVRDVVESFIDLSILTGVTSNIDHIDAFGASGICPFPYTYTCWSSPDVLYVDDVPYSVVDNMLTSAAPFETLKSGNGFLLRRCDYDMNVYACATEITGACDTVINLFGGTNCDTVPIYDVCQMPGDIYVYQDVDVVKNRAYSLKLTTQPVTESISLSGFNHNGIISMKYDCTSGGTHNSQWDVDLTVNPSISQAAFNSGTMHAKVYGLNNNDIRAMIFAEKFGQWAKQGTNYEMLSDYVGMPKDMVGDVSAVISNYTIASLIAGEMGTLITDQILSNGANTVNFNTGEYDVVRVVIGYEGGKGTLKVYNVNLTIGSTGIIDNNLLFSGGSDVTVHSAAGGGTVYTEGVHYTLDRKPFVFGDRIGQATTITEITGLPNVVYVDYNKHKVSPYVGTSQDHQGHSLTDADAYAELYKYYTSIMSNLTPDTVFYACDEHSNIGTDIRSGADTSPTNVLSLALNHFDWIASTLRYGDANRKVMIKNDMFDPYHHVFMDSYMYKALNANPAAATALASDYNGVAMWLYDGGLIARETESCEGQTRYGNLLDPSVFPYDVLETISQDIFNAPSDISVYPEVLINNSADYWASKGFKVSGTSSTYIPGNAYNWLKAVDAQGNNAYGGTYSFWCNDETDFKYLPEFAEFAWSPNKLTYEQFASKDYWDDYQDSVPLVNRIDTKPDSFRANLSLATNKIRINFSSNENKFNNPVGYMVYTNSSPFAAANSTYLSGPYTAFYNINVTDSKDFILEFNVKELFTTIAEGWEIHLISTDPNQYISVDRVNFAPFEGIRAWKYYYSGGWQVDSLNQFQNKEDNNVYENIRIVKTGNKLSIYKNDAYLGTALFNSSLMIDAVQLLPPSGTVFREISYAPLITGNYYDDTDPEDNAAPSSVGIGSTYLPYRWYTDPYVGFSWANAIDYGTSNYYFVKGVDEAGNPSNLVYNGDFENGVSGWNDNGGFWAISDQCDGSNMCMYMQTVTTYWSGVNQIIDLKPNTTYIVFANTKDYGRVHAHILRADDSISRNLGDIIGPNYGGWADGSATFTTGADEVKIRLHSIIAPYDVIGPQLGYVDDIEMYELSSIEYVSGVKGYSIELNESMIIPDNSTELSGTEVYADLYEGVNYFAVRAVDNSGNLGDTNYYGPLYYCSGTLIDADNDDGAEIDPEDMDNICGVCGEPYIGYICSNDVDAELNGVCGDGYCTSYPDCCNSGDCLSGEFCSGANCPESFGTCEEGTDDPNIPEFSWTGLLLMIAITLIGSMMLIRSKKKKR